jgi:hypothetical protein
LTALGLSTFFHKDVGVLKLDYALLVMQILNGLQLGLLLFLVASGLTLVFGILDFVNLAHASLYMVENVEEYNLLIN